MGNINIDVMKSAAANPTKRPTCSNTNDWYRFNNNCYYFSAITTPDSRKSWEEANTYCMSNGGYLVSIHGNDENNFLKTFIGNYNINSFWCGLREHAASGKYEWSDGSPLDYQQWLTGEPNDFNGEEECAQFYVHDGTWNDLNCGDKIPFICKKPQGTSDPITSLPTPVPSGKCPGSSFRHNNKCYWIHGAEKEDRLGWQEARTKCAEFGHLNGGLVTLATIHNQELQSFLNTQLKSLDYNLWIGLSDITSNGQFRWADGATVDFTHWGSGEPNEASGKEDCVEMMSDENRLGEWNDVACNKPNGFICQQLPSTNVHEPPQTTNDCRRGYTQYHNSCFKVLSRPRSFSAAVDVCKSGGTGLATITDAYEEAFVETLLHSSGGEALWIGLMNDEIGPYKWVNDSPVLYTNWGHGEPSEKDNEGCVRVKYNGAWDSTVCDAMYKPLCKYSLLDTPANLPESPGICEEGWKAYGRHCYQYNYGDDTETSWPEAEFYCNRQGAYVASVHSKQENEWIRTSLAAGSHDDIWIGLHRTDSNGFQWQDNTPVAYDNWASNEPTYTWDVEHENCVQMYISNGQWNDVDCLHRQSYICKKPKSLVSVKKSDAIISNDLATATQAPGNPSLLHGQSAQPQTGGMSSGGIIGLVIGTLLLILAAGLIIFFVVTHKSSKKATLDIAGRDVAGFDNALYRAKKESVQVKDEDEEKQKTCDIAPISDSKTMTQDPESNP
ncbi:macrophage mannose receptor 1-like isoform X2 [Amphiura filiformis]|uniref:macrophage mannose receptor 1-like isoform X2 n=1 Tax=Amphiura filiformis TaxID=82378 RepID=UPI003B21551D